MHSISSRFPVLVLFFLVLFTAGLTGCNLLGSVRAGPHVPFAEDKAGGGAEVDGELLIDMGAGFEWIHRRPQPETAFRFGMVSGSYTHLTTQGFGIGFRPGAFIGSTNGRGIFLAQGFGQGGVETLHGDPYGALGGGGALTGGFAIVKNYDERAIILCRSLTFLTFTAQGSVLVLPDGPPDRDGSMPSIPSFTFLVGIVQLEDGGSPSDVDDPRSHGLCPR